MLEWHTLAAFDLATAADLFWRTDRTVPVVPERRDVGVVYAFEGRTREPADTARIRVTCA
ncbi:MAG: hypothetical protein ACRDP6_21990 [Actinoallomurus sp.]